MRTATGLVETPILHSKCLILADIGIGHNLKGSVSRTKWVVGLITQKTRN